MGIWLIYYETSYGKGNCMLVLEQIIPLDDLLNRVIEIHNKTVDTVKVHPGEVVIVNMIRMK